MRERETGYVPPYSAKEVMDTDWYDRFEEIGSFEAYTYFDIKKEEHPDAFVRFEEQKKKFIAGEIGNPKLEYPKLDANALALWEKKLLELKNDVINLEENEVVRQAYRWKINEKLVETRMLQMAEKGDARLFKRYNEFVNGKPDIEIFNYVVGLVQKKIERARAHEKEEVRALATELDSIFGHITPKHFELPDAASIATAKEATLKEVHDLVTLSVDYAPDKKIESTEIAILFGEALEKLRADDWSVVRVEGSRTAIHVSQENKKVEIPTSRSVVKKELEGLVAHEVGTHIARRKNGERTQLKLLGLGLDRYLKGEEGVATLREQSVKEKVDAFVGLEGYLSIGLAYGLDGVKRDFRGVYSVLEKYHTLSEVLLKDKSVVDVQKEAQTKAWARTMRTFRGTDGKTPGVCYTKDLVYHEGNMAMWDVVKQNPAEMDRFSIGKYDPSNERHLWVMSQLGIGEKDVEQLEV